MEYALVAENISKVYGRKKVLNNISMKVKKGSIHGLIGKNGSGKTTLMRVLTGLTNPTEGRYTLFDSCDLELGHKRIGLLIENPGIYKNLSAKQNLEYFRILYGVPEKEIVEELLTMVGLKEAINKKSKKLSLGMKQRLSIAIALLGNPDMLILDEPINGLDPEGVFEIRNLLIKLNEEKGVTIIISSHILSELFKLATDYMIIDKGNVIEQISKEELEAKINKCIKIEIHKDDVKKASIILEQKLGIKGYEVLHNNIFRILGNVDISDINIALAKEEIKILSVSHSGEDPEEYFLNKVRESR